MSAAHPRRHLRASVAKVALLDADDAKGEHDDTCRDPTEDTSEAGPGGAVVVVVALVLVVSVVVAVLECKKVGSDVEKL